MNALSNELFDVYCRHIHVKDIWDSFSKKYLFEDESSKNYVIGCFHEFKMVDEKSIMDQVHEYQNILNEILGEGIKIDDVFQITSLIEKLSLSWKDYKASLKHKRKELTLENRIVRIRSEDKNRLQDSNEKVKKLVSKAHHVETHGMKKMRLKANLNPIIVEILREIGTIRNTCKGNVLLMEKWVTMQMFVDTGRSVEILPRHKSTWPKCNTLHHYAHITVHMSHLEC